jgi:hypothetical protein
VQDELEAANAVDPADILRCDVLLTVCVCLMIIVCVMCSTLALLAAPDEQLEAEIDDDESADDDASDEMRRARSARKRTGDKMSASAADDDEETAANLANAATDIAALKQVRGRVTWVCDAGHSCRRTRWQPRLCVSVRAQHRHVFVFALDAC